MSTPKKNETFKYTYSAKQQAEIEKIREKYEPREESKIETLRRLDASVSKKATIVSLAAGIVGALVLGLGMCCCLVWQGVWFIPGIAVGILGMAVISLAYPLYNRTIKKEREKIAPEVIRLADELMK